MNKKVIIIGSAVIAFFAGAIWVSEVPVVATLVAFLELCVGGVLGFLFCKQCAAENAALAEKNAKAQRPEAKKSTKTK